jgi:succinate dehydrogenase hydrophobic anchor subunit
MVSFAEWRQLQAASGLVFGLFVILHFVSHYANIESWSSGLSMLLKMRGWYQRPVVEVVVFASLLLHMVANTNVYMKRAAMEKSSKLKKDGDSKKGSPSPPGSIELKGQRITGIILSFIIVGHVAATRGAALFVLDDPSQYDYSVLYRVAKDFPRHVFPIYLCIFGMAANWHFVFGVRSAVYTLLGQSVHNRPFPLFLKPVAVVLHVLIIVSVLSVTGYRYAVDVRDKDHVYEAISKAIGI